MESGAGSEAEPSQEGPMSEGLPGSEPEELEAPMPAVGPRRRGYRPLGSGNPNGNKLSNAPQQAALVIKHLIGRQLRMALKSEEREQQRRIILQIYDTLWKKRRSIGRISVLTRQYDDAKFSQLYQEIHSKWRRESIQNACSIFRRVILNTLETIGPSDIQRVINRKRRPVDCVRIHQYFNEVILANYSDNSCVQIRAHRHQTYRVRESMRNMRDQALRRTSTRDYPWN